MKKAIRWVVARIVRWTDKHCCPTYGDVAELSKGPCQRCVGREVRGPVAVSDTPNDQAQFRAERDNLERLVGAPNQEERKG